MRFDYWAKSESEASMNHMRIQHAHKLIQRAIFEVERDNILVGWRLLEEAHIFSQPFALLHAYVHCEMLSLAFRQKDYREICGQLLRTLLAVPASLLGKYPVGNSGRSASSLFGDEVMPKRLVDKLLELDVLEQRRIKAGGILPKYQPTFRLRRIPK
jgi:hypothetical protein